MYVSDGASMQQIVATAMLAAAEVYRKDGGERLIVSVMDGPRVMIW